MQQSGGTILNQKIQTMQIKIEFRKKSSKVGKLDCNSAPLIINDQFKLLARQNYPYQWRVFQPAENCLFLTMKCQFLLKQSSPQKLQLQWWQSEWIFHRNFSNKFVSWWRDVTVGMLQCSTQLCLPSVGMKTNIKCLTLRSKLLLSRMPLSLQSKKFDKFNEKTELCPNGDVSMFCWTLNIDFPNTIGFHIRTEQLKPFYDLPGNYLVVSKIIIKTRQSRKVMASSSIQLWFEGIAPLNQHLNLPDKKGVKEINSNISLSQSLFEVLITHLPLIRHFQLWLNICQLMRRAGAVSRYLGHDKIKTSLRKVILVQWQVLPNPNHDVVLINCFLYLLIFIERIITSILPSPFRI